MDTGNHGPSERTNGHANVDLWNTLFRENTRTGDEAGAGTGSRVWMHIDDKGVASEVEVDKHLLVYQLGIRYRDLLTLDPTLPLPFPAALFIRERAIVVNLETDKDPFLAARPTYESKFIHKLCELLSAPLPRTASSQSLQKMAVLSATYTQNMPYELRALEVALATVTTTLETEVYHLEQEAYPVVNKLLTDLGMPVLEGVRKIKAAMNKLISRAQRLKQEMEEILEDDDDMADMYLGRRARERGEQLPQQPREVPGTERNMLVRGGPGSESRLVPLFEFESAQPLPRESSTSSVTSMSTQQQWMLGPDARRRPISRVSFNSVAGSIDQPAAELGAMGAGRAKPGAAEAVDLAVAQSPAPGGAGRRPSPPSATETGQRTEPAPSESGSSEEEEEETSSRRRMQRGRDRSPRRQHSRARRVRDRVDPHDIEEAEDQLETYYVKVDAALRRLLMVSEAIDANEDMVDIQLDHRRNELVALDLLVSLMVAAFGFVSMVAGFWGMNLFNTEWQESWNLFLGTCIFSGVGACILFFGILAVIIKRRLMFIPSSI